MVDKQWEDFLNPAVMQERLISASLYITAYEVLKESIIGRLKDFYCIGFDSQGSTVSSEYQEDVLKLNKSPLYASLMWLKNRQAIDDKDFQSFENIKRVRNLLAHELHLVVFTGKYVELMDQMQDLMDLMRKIGVWWVINVEIPTNPDFDGQEVNQDEITPGPILILQMMFEVISGNETLLEKYKKAVADKL